MAAEPNPSELEVLKALWSSHRLSAREIHDRIGDAQGWSYSTTRTVVQRMVDKGLVNKDSVHGLAVFAAAQNPCALECRRQTCSVLGRTQGLRHEGEADCAVRRRVERDRNLLVDALVDQRLRGGAEEGAKLAAALGRVSLVHQHNPDLVGARRARAARRRRGHAPRRRLAHSN